MLYLPNFIRLLGLVVPASFLVGTPPMGGAALLMLSLASLSNTYFSKQTLQIEELVASILNISVGMKLVIPSLAVAVTFAN
jgi:hypothetical protein